MKRPLIFFFVVLGLVGVVLPVMARAECWEHYQRMTLAKHLAMFPLPEYERWNQFAYTEKGRVKFANSYLGNTPQGVEAAVLLRYSAEWRPTGVFPKQALNSFGGEAVAKLFNSELHVVEQGYNGWLMVQDSLVPILKKEMKKGDHFTACLVLIGRTDTYQLYIMNEWEERASGR